MGAAIGCGLYLCNVLPDTKPPCVVGREGGEACQRSSHSPQFQICLCEEDGDGGGSGMLLRGEVASGGFQGGCQSGHRWLKQRPEDSD